MTAYTIIVTGLAAATVLIFAALCIIIGWELRSPRPGRRARQGTRLDRQLRAAELESAMWRADLSRAGYLATGVDEPRAISTEPFPPLPDGYVALSAVSVGWDRLEAQQHGW